MRAATLQRRHVSQASPEPLGIEAERGRLDAAACGLDPRERRAAQSVEDAGLHGRWPPRSPSQPMRTPRGVEVVDAAPRTTARVGDRERHARVPAGLHVEQRGDVLDRARHRPFGAEQRDPDVGRRPARHAALARPKAVDVVPAGRVAQAPHEVAAVGDRQHVRRQRDRGAAAAAARRSGRVEGVAGDAEDFVEGVRAEAELGRVGLADDDAAGRLHPLDHQRVVVGNVVGEQRRAERAADAPASRRRP